MSSLTFPDLVSPALPRLPYDKGWGHVYGLFPPVEDHLNICDAPSIPDFILKQLVDERFIHCSSSAAPKIVDVESVLRDNRIYIIKHGLLKDESHPAIRMQRIVLSLGYDCRYYDVETAKIRKKSFADFLHVAPATLSNRPFQTLEEWHSGKLAYGRLHFKSIFEGMSRFFIDLWKFDAGDILLEWYETHTISEIVAFEHLMAAYLPRAENLLRQTAEMKRIRALAEEMIKKGNPT